MTNDEKLHLLSEINILGSYDVVVVDMDFQLDKSHMDLYHKMNAMVLVGDGSEVSNMKVQRALAALQILEESKDDPLTQRLALVYNKFSNKTCKTIDGLQIENIGGAPRYEHATTKQVVKQLAAMEMFEKLM